MMNRLKKIIEDTDTLSGRRFDLFIQLLIILSLISFTIETLQNLPDTLRYALNVFEIVTVLIFTIEYILRVVVADSKRKFIFSFYGMIDLLAILPFYLATGVDLRSLRILRLFRLFRILKLFRFSETLQRFQTVFIKVKSELALFAIAAFFLLYLSSVGIYYFEHEAQPENFGSIFHCLWWSVATLTTVGYGDVYPVTVGGKIFTSFIVLIGIGIVAVPTGILASALTKTVGSDE